MKRVGEVDPAGESKVTWRSSPRGDCLASDMGSWLVRGPAQSQLSAWRMPPFQDTKALMFDSIYRIHFSYHFPAMADDVNFSGRLVPDCLITSHPVYVLDWPGAHWGQRLGFSFVTFQEPGWCCPVWQSIGPCDFWALEIWLMYGENVPWILTHTLKKIW